MSSLNYPKYQNHCCFTQIDFHKKFPFTFCRFRGPDAFGALFLCGFFSFFRDEGTLTAGECTGTLGNRLSKTLVSEADRFSCKDFSFFKSSAFGGESMSGAAFTAYRTGTAANKLSKKFAHKKEKMIFFSTEGTPKSIVHHLGTIWKSLTKSKKSRLWCVMLVETPQV